MVKMDFANAAYYHSRAMAEGITPATSLDADHLTHVFYASASVNSDGTVWLADDRVHSEMEIDGSKGAIRACQALKLSNPRLKVILSVGGEQFDRQFHNVAAVPSARLKFADTVRAIVDKYRLDGIDIDWETPDKPQAGNNFVSLLEAVRKQLPAPQYLLTAVLPPLPEDLAQMDVRKIGRIVDYCNLMSYDLVGPWSLRSGHQAQLYNLRTTFTLHATPTVHASVTYLLGKGVPASKLLLGIPTHGRAFTGVTIIGQEYKKHRYPADNKRVPYKDLLPPNCYEDNDSNAVAAYIVDREAGRFITFDSALTVEMKGEYVKQNRLGGFFFSDASSDRSDYKSLIRAGHSSLYD